MLLDLIRACTGVVRAAELTGRTSSLTYLRLTVRAARSPARRSGRFHFPFGELRYVDALSMKLQYLEIFALKGYEVAGLPDTARILDCGGNIGLSTIWFKQRYPRSHVIVFEADPRIGSVLTRNIMNLGLTDVTVINAAVGAMNGTANFVADGSDSGRVSDEPGIPVPAVRLADYIDGPINLLKIDIEGAEYGVLADIAATGHIDFVQTIVGELHGRSTDVDKIGRFCRTLADAGFLVTFPWATSHEGLPGSPDSTPFPAVTTGKFLLRFYAWRPPS